MTEPTKVPASPELLQTIQDQVDFATKLIKRESTGAEGMLITCHFLKNGRVVSNRVYENWPLGDWGQAMIYLGCEAKAARMIIESGGR